MRILAATTGHMGYLLLRALLDSGHEVAGLLQSARKVRRPVWQFALPRLLKYAGANQSAMGIARKHRLPIFYIDRMTEQELAPVRALEPDLLVIAGFDIIIKRPLIELPRVGAINIHSSLLPKHRGPNPFRAVIAANEQESGVTFHVVDEGIDTGDIVAQYPFPIRPRDDSGVLYRRASKLGAEKICEVIEQIEREGLKGEPQDSEFATYDKNPPVEDRFIDWNQPAEEAFRKIRSYLPFYLPRFRMGNKVVYIGKADYDDEECGATPGTILRNRRPVRIATGKGRLSVFIAYTRRPFPWLWPTPWGRPKVGDKAE